jgi:hypothetical protein
MVERYIKTVEHLRKAVAYHQRNWDERIPLFLLAYRASTHDNTGSTPASLVFGRELRPTLWSTARQGTTDDRSCGRFDGTFI